MRRAKLALSLFVPVVAILAIAAPAAVAQTSTYTCYPGTPGAFNITDSTLVNNTNTTPLPNGTPIPGGFVAHSNPPSYDATLETGIAVNQFTNLTTQKSIDWTSWAPQWFTYDPTPTIPGALATGTYVAIGGTYQLFGPDSIAALAAKGIHEPTLVYTNGVLIMHFAVNDTGPYVTSFTLDGTQENGCAALSH